MISINDILKIVSKNVSATDLNIINRAYSYSARVHSGQVRMSGEPYLSHPLEVAGILTKMKLDPVSIASGLLHDVIEDTYATKEEVKKKFGPNVEHIVSGVTKLSKFTFDNSKTRTAETFRKMLLAMADDIRVILIKLADRLHNMRTLEFHKSEEKKKKISTETLNIYAPIALKLGIYWIKTELENMSLKHLNNKEYKSIKKFINENKKEQKSYIKIVKQRIKEILIKNNINCNMSGRYKSIYSIYQKMQKQQISFDAIHDLIAFRIILKTPEECYNTLGYIHAQWKPVPDRIKDYIGMPKSNMYQSLHTTVIGLSGKRMEIQIRTEKMDKIAESGIAAHWAYKEGKTINIINSKITETFKWVQDMIENQKYTNDPDELLEALRIDLFPNDVYVFTPKGDIKSLPKGATPIDFAYSIHSEIGNQCTGCKVNGQMTPLRYKLRNGETVEIIISKEQYPNKNWLDFVRTIKARSRIKQWIRIKERIKNFSLGKEICEKEFNKYKINFNNFVKQKHIDKIIEKFGFDNVDDLIINIGYGKITPLQLISEIKPYKPSKQEFFLDKIIQRITRKNNKIKLIINKQNNMLIKFEDCCNPIPGDSVIGYINKEQGVTIHKSDCNNITTMNSEQKIKVKWGKTTKETYPVNITINSSDRVGLLADIAGHISKTGANIISAKIKTVKKGNTSCSFTITIKNIKHLNKLISSLKKINHVINVKRTS